MLAKAFFVQIVPLKIFRFISDLSTGPKSNFPSNCQLKLFNNCNSLVIISNKDEDIFKINSKFFTIKQFLRLGLNDNFLSLFHANTVSLNQYLDDLHNLASIIQLQIQVIGICEHNIKKGSCLNCSPPGYTFEFEPITSTHGGVGVFINDNLCYKVRNDLKILLNGCLESTFIEISFDKKKKNIDGLIYRPLLMPINDFCDSSLIECLNQISLLDNTCILMDNFNNDLLNRTQTMSLQSFQK